jgi:hypothetical protein
MKTVYRNSSKKHQEKLVEVEIATNLPGIVRVVQFPALPNMTLLRIGVRLSGKRHEKVPAALARWETDTRYHLCRETREISVPWAHLAHANPDVDLSHPLSFVRGEDETFTRAR